MTEHKYRNADGTTEDKYLTRKEAAAYLASIGCPLAPKTLANLAANNNAGNGPPFIHRGRGERHYPVSGLREWAQRAARMVE